PRRKKRASAFRKKRQEDWGGFRPIRFFPRPGSRILPSAAIFFLFWNNTLFLYRVLVSLRRSKITKPEGMHIQRMEWDTWKKEEVRGSVSDIPSPIVKMVAMSSPIKGTKREKFFKNHQPAIPVHGNVRADPGIPDSDGLDINLWLSYQSGMKKYPRPDSNWCRRIQSPA